MTKSCFGVGNSWRLFLLVWRFHSITTFKKGMNMYVYNMIVTSSMGMSYDEDKMQIELRKPKADKVQTASRSSTLNLSMTNLLQPILLQPPKQTNQSDPDQKSFSGKPSWNPCLGTGYLSLYTLSSRNILCNQCTYSANCPSPPNKPSASSAVIRLDVKDASTLS